MENRAHCPLFRNAMKFFFEKRRLFGCIIALSHRRLKTPSASTSSSFKRKPMKRIARKFMEDPSLRVLFKDMRLSHPGDEENLNALHCFVRAKLLEVYSLQAKGLNDANNNHDGKASEPPNVVGIRCAFCGFLPRKERGKGQTMSTFFPKSIGEIYRGVCTWQRIHFPVCEHMPEDYRTEYKMRKEQDLTRGKKSHWIRSAYDLGLRNVDSERNGLTYQPGSPFDIQEVLSTEIDPGGRSKNSRTPKRSPESRVGGTSTAVASTFGRDEFELFGTDFDRSLEESAEAVATKVNERAF